MINLLISTNNCADYALANMLNTVHQVINMIAIIVPILLIISIIFSLVSFLVNVDQKNKGKKIIQKVAAAIIVFLLPTIVDTTMSLLDYAGGDIESNNFQVASCWTLAAKGTTSSSNINSGAGTNTSSTKKSSTNSITGDLSGLKNLQVVVAIIVTKKQISILIGATYQDIINLVDIVDTQFVLVAQVIV